MSRGLAYWNSERIRFIRENFVAVAVPTWVCREEGPEGEFLRGAGIEKHWVTSSGYKSCVSAGGKYLGGDPTEEVMEAFAALPAGEREAGAVEVRDLRPEEVVIPAPPEEGMVLKVHARFLAKDGSGKLRHAGVEDFPAMRDDAEMAERWAQFLEPNTEYLWLTRGEVEGLVPAAVADSAEVGQKIAVDPAVAMRMARFHVNPKRATTSEGGAWSEKEVKEAALGLVVEEVTEGRIGMRVEGRVHWGTDYDAALATSPDGPLAMGYEAPISGRLEYDRAEKKIVRFDMVAAGEVWGRWGDANNKSMEIERPGRAPFGFAFEMAHGESPTERIPPGGNGKYVSEESRRYFPVVAE